ncbi:hypothetical protein K438DRAFT_1966951 [Mycena galopus ATCC 62051]|nr:hypothetical protein K438DRAFT_1966951 [Mycena galopus ATCC 62051]
MSIQDLRARVVKLNSEIDIQKKVLEKLERDKCIVLRQLNEAVDPVAHLPLEISSEIFLQSLPPISKPGPLHLPMLLLNICSAWTNISVATPSLWASIQIDFPCSEGLAEVLPIWFQRARNHPLSVSFQGDFSHWNNRVSAVVWRHSRQLKRLKISNDVYNGGQDYEEPPVDLFGNTIPESLPLLETLTICSVEGGQFIGPKILEFLRRAPNIVELIVGRLEYIDNPDSAAEKLVLPTLRRLVLGEGDYSDDTIIDCLSLPVLETLSVPMRGLTWGGLIRFFKRSAPLIQELIVGWDFDMGFVHVHECLLLIPSLVRLKMWKPFPKIAIEFFAALDNSSSLLPHLRRLTIHLDTETEMEPVSSISDSSWRILLRVVSTRRLQLHLVGYLLMVPPADVLVAFRELLAEGLQVCGSALLNFSGEADAAVVFLDDGSDVINYFHDEEEEQIACEGAGNVFGRERRRTGAILHIRPERSYPLSVHGINMHLSSIHGAAVIEVVRRECGQFLDPAVLEADIQVVVHGLPAKPLVDSLEFAQLFFCQRLWAISRNNYVPAAIIMLFVLGLVTSFVNTAFDFANAQSGAKTWLAIHLASVFGGDAILCGTTTFFLLRHSKQVLPETAGMFNAILKLTFQSAAPAAVCALINLVCSQAGSNSDAVNAWSMLAIISNTMLPKLYAISAMWTLNSRKNIRLARSTGQNTSSGEATNGGLSGGRRRTNNVELGALSLSGNRTNLPIQVRTQVQTIQRSDDMFSKSPMPDDMSEHDSTLKN